MLLLRVFLPFALGYFLSYLFRSINAVVGPRLVEEFGLAPEALGFLTSAYFLTFAAAQLPLGLALDRLGPRRTEAFLLLFAAGGALLFAYAGDTNELILARALIGLGASACLMASFKAFVIWFPTERLPFLNGCVLAVGGLGAIVATAPVELALGLTGWRTLFLFLAALTLAAAALLFLLVPEKPRGATRESLSAMLRGLGSVFASPLFWRIGPAVLTGSAAAQAFSGLWAGPWLRDVGGYDAGTTSTLLMVMAAGMSVGFLLLGAALQQAMRRGLDPLRAATFALLVFVALQAGLVANATDLAWPLLALFGFFSTAIMLLYSALVPAFPLSLSGRVSTAMNLLTFVGAFLGQWLVGLLIGLPGGENGRYSPAGYSLAFAVLLGAEVLALGWLLTGLRRFARPPANREQP